jgi:hypothetical protein
VRNLTITLNDELASRVRVMAAERGLSMSRFVASVLEERAGLPNSQHAALRDILSFPKLHLTDASGHAPSADERRE